jgi:hypothetical protein
LVASGMVHSMLGVRTPSPRKSRLAGFVHSIDDILGFANAVSLKLPYFTQGFEGPVIFQDETAIYKNCAAAAEELMERYRNPDGTLRMEMLQDMAGRMGGIEGRTHASMNE